MLRFHSQQLAGEYLGRSAPKVSYRNQIKRNQDVFQSDHRVQRYLIGRESAGGKIHVRGAGHGGGAIGHVLLVMIQLLFVRGSEKGLRARASTQRSVERTF